MAKNTLTMFGPEKCQKRQNLKSSLTKVNLFSESFKHKKIEIRPPHVWVWAAEVRILKSSKSIYKQNFEIG